MFEKAVKNYFRSEGVLAEEMPYLYIPFLPRYVRRPLNRFKQPDTNQAEMPSPEQMNARIKH